VSLIDDNRKAIAKANAAARAKAPVPDASPPCRNCDRTPTVDTTFRSLAATRRSWIMKRQSGPFCRDCGIASFRAMTARTFVKGWWNPGAVFAATYIVIVNTVRRRKVAALLTPQFEVAGRHPSPVGNPLFLRRESLGALVPVVFFGGIVLAAWTLTSAAIGSNPTGTKVGECVRMYPTAIVECSGPHDGRIVKIVKTADDCPAGSTIMEVGNAAGNYQVDAGDDEAECVAPD
jgi:hypothetical protein